MKQQKILHKNTDEFSSLKVLRISVGVIYLWFGALKFFHGLSPAEQLAQETIHKLTFGLINDQLNILILASWESIIGVLLITGKWVKPALAILFLHMLCTFTPFLFFPSETFRIAPYALSLTGQYIMKNIIIIAAGIVLWKTEEQKQNQLKSKSNTTISNLKYLEFKKNSSSEYKVTGY